MREIGSCLLHWQPLYLLLRSYLAIISLLVFLAFTSSLFPVRKSQFKEKGKVTFAAKVDLNMKLDQKAAQSVHEFKAVFNCKKELEFRRYDTATVRPMTIGTSDNWSLDSWSQGNWTPDKFSRQLF